MWNKSVSRINYIFVKAECGKFVETINVIYDDDDDNATIVFSESINSIFVCACLIAFFPVNDHCETQTENISPYSSFSHVLNASTSNQFIELLWKCNSF